MIRNKTENRSECKREKGKKEEEEKNKIVKMDEFKAGKETKENKKK